jgi:glycosyltransferase involved in cell wall biosynthesis
MINEPFFSIIVPIFNVEKFLRNCLESIATQDFKNYEVLMIDDKSTDSSLAIAKSFSLNHINFKLYNNEENKGLSYTRNQGIKLAKGVFLIFLDSDDELHFNCLIKIWQVLIKNLEIDILACSVDKIGTKNISRLTNTDFSGTINGDTFLSNQILKGTFYVSACRYLYNLEYLKNNNLSFKEGIFHEDELWSPIVISKAKKILNFTEPYYKNFIRENSITNNTKNIKKRYYDVLTIYNELNIISFAPVKYITRSLIIEKSTSLLFHSIYLYRIYEKKFPNLLFLKSIRIKFLFENKIYLFLLKLFPIFFILLYLIRLNFFNRNTLKLLSRRIKKF